MYLWPQRIGCQIFYFVEDYYNLSGPQRSNYISDEDTHRRPNEVEIVSSFCIPRSSFE